MNKNNTRELEMAKLIFDDGEVFLPSAKEMQVLSDVVQLFRDVQSARDRNFQYFDGINIIDYIDDSVLRFNTNVDERDGIEDWQAGVHDPFTRNKVLAFHGKLMESLPIATFSGRGDEDHQRGILLSNLYEYVEDVDNYEELMSNILLECIVKGTAIGYEDVKYEKKKYRDVKGVGDEMTITERTEKTTKLVGSLVPLEEFYPSSVSIRRIEDMPYAFWRKVIPFTEFRDSFKNYKKSQLVSGKESYGPDENRPYYSDFIDFNIPDGNVEVIKYFDKMNDEYVIIANGIWLNPISLKEGEGTREEISPLPWNHKDLPFYDIKFDMFGDFFYGKSLPDRLKSMQDVLNVLTNMLLDQSFLSIFPPLLTNGFDSIEDDYLRPGRRTPVDTQGLPIQSAFQILQNPTPSGWHQYILEYTRKVMEESSLDKVSQGQAGGGDRTTAQEIRVAASGVASILQVVARNVNYAIKRKAQLKASNTLQFGLNPDAPIIQRIIGEGGEEQFNKAFATIKVDNTILTKGKRGTKLIELYRDESSLPNRGEIKARAQIAKNDTNKDIEIVAIPPTYLRNFTYDVKVVPNPKNEATKDIEKAMQLEKVQVYLNFFPEFINKAELAAETAEKMGDDPAKILTQQTFQPPPVEGQGQQGANANNMVRSAKGGEQGPAELAALMQG